MRLSGQRTTQMPESDQDPTPWGKVEGNDGDRCRGGGTFELASNLGSSSVTKAAVKASTKAVGGNNDAPRPSQLSDPPPNFSLNDDNNDGEEKDSDENDKTAETVTLSANGREGMFLDRAGRPLPRIPRPRRPRTDRR